MFRALKGRFNPVLWFGIRPPFQGFIQWMRWFPGRCPGLTWCAPLGLGVGLAWSALLGLGSGSFISTKGAPYGSPGQRPGSDMAQMFRAAKVDQLMAWVDQLETQLATSRAQAEKLLEALVAELTH